MLGYLDAHPEADAHRHAETVADILLLGIGREGHLGPDPDQEHTRRPHPVAVDGCPHPPNPGRRPSSFT